MMIGGVAVAIGTFVSGYIGDRQASSRKYILVFGMILLMTSTGLLKIKTPWFEIPGVLTGLVETGSTVAQV